MPKSERVDPCAGGASCLVREGPKPYSHLGSDARPVPVRADLGGAVDRAAGADQRAVGPEDEDRNAAAKSI